MLRRGRSSGLLRRHHISIAAGAALSFMACCLVAIHQYACTLEQRYVRTLAPATTLWAQKTRAIAIQRWAFSQADLLPVYGSSELIIGSTHDADQVFKYYPTGFRPFTVASPAATPIILTLRLGSLGAALHGKRVVITITPPEFYRPRLEQPSYNGNSPVCRRWR